MSHTHPNRTRITPGHGHILNALIGDSTSNVALLACRVNDEPAVAIVTIERDDGEEFCITPLFVSVTDGMTLTDHEGLTLGEPEMPYWRKRIMYCDGLEIQPIRDASWDDAKQGPRPFLASGENESNCEPCAPAEAHFWSVYGHLKGGGIDCFEDFATQAEASAFAAKLYRAYLHLKR